ncbi:roundabout homolog 1-like [Photinus pyralis]|uniref:roundabout homolog 1-like n=1 Tax=Photinus pyralis TaxID=7054 RepID=UPI0012671CDE|nr:roundabout homolog 1-like [Photinus pyralis]
MRLLNDVHHLLFLVFIVKMYWKFSHETAVQCLQIEEYFKPAFLQEQPAVLQPPLQTQKEGLWSAICCHRVGEEALGPGQPPPKLCGRQLLKRSESQVIQTSNPVARFSVLRDEFRLEPQSARVAAGEDVLLECGPPRGTPEPQVTWRKDGHTLDLDKRLRLVDGSSLAITDAKPSDDGRYQCVARNTAGIRESAIAVIKVHVKPFLVRPPEDITALVGSTVEFSCGVGGDPLPDVLWRRNSPGGTMPLGRVRVLEDRSLRLERITLQDQGRYTCEADNPAGALTASATLTVHAVPSFNTKPLAQTVETGQKVSFQCNAQGNPRPFVFWSFEGDRSLIFPGTPSGNFEAFASSDGHSTLILRNAQIQNSGTVITCSAVNSAGSTSARTRLTVTSKEDRPPPVIIRGPVNQSLPIQSLAVLSCDATGNPEPAIDWYKDDIPVMQNDKIKMTKPGKLEISHLAKEDSGVYTCVASSKGGKATWSGHLLVENPKNPNINFFKAPDAVMLPGPPSRPHVLNQSEGSVTITWAQNNKIGSSSLLGYQIELFGKEEGVTPTWTVVGRRVHGPSFTQHLLTPGIAYTFLVRAENAHGLGPPSQLSEPIFVGTDSALNWGNPEVTEISEARASLISDNIAHLVETIPVLSTAVKLVWEIIDAQYVEGLYIYYVPVDGAPDMPRSYGMLTVLHTGGSSAFTVSNLAKWARYEFFLVPFYKTVEGMPSNSRIVRTLEDVPAESPSHMEALLLNSTAVYLKWRCPPLASLNGELQGYRVEVKANRSESQVETVTVGGTPTLLLGNLTTGITYHVRVAATTRAGVGPFSVPAMLRLDPASRVSDQHQQKPIGAEMQPGEFVTETWFMALLISMVTVMVLLFGAMMLVRRRQLLAKKALPASRSNGGVLSTPLALKQEAPLWMDKECLPEYASTLPEYAKLAAHDYSREYNSLNAPNGLLAQSAHSNVNIHPNPMHQIDFSRPDQNFKCFSEISRHYDKNLKDYSNMQVQDYASPTLGIDSGRTSIADYAEVDSATAVLPSGATSPAPYATTTLVTGSRRIANSLQGWNPNCASSSPDEPIYPAINGGYYNRSVYSDSYFPTTHTLKRNKRERKGSSGNPPDLVSPSQPVYARVGPPGTTWRGGAPSLSSFIPQKQMYHASTRSEPGNML